MDSNRPAYLFAFLAVLLWGSTPAVSKLLLSDINNFQLLLFTSFFASMTLFAIAMAQGKYKLILSYKAGDYLTFAYMGFLGVFLYYVFLYGAIALLPAQEAFIINYLWLMMVVLFAAPILKEKFTALKFASMAISFAGVVVVATKGNILHMEPGNFSGILMAVLGAVSYGLFSVLGKKHDYDRTTSIAFYYFFGFVFTLIFALVNSQIFTPNPNQLLGFLWLGAFNSALAFLFWFLALKYGDTAKISNIIYLTPFVSLIYIFFLVGEQIAISSIIGLVLIISGVLTQSKAS